MKIFLPILTLSFLHILAYANTNSDDTEARANPDRDFARAVKAEDIELVEKLIMAGVDVNSPRIVGYLGGADPLEHSVSIGNIQMTRLLIDKGANIEAQNNARRSPIYWTAFNGDETLALMLLKAEADPDPVDYFGRTPAFWARQSGYPEIADILDASANAANEEEAQLTRGK